MSETIETTEGWKTKEDGCNYLYKFPKSQAWVLRQIWYHKVFYTGEFSPVNEDCEEIDENRKQFKLWSSLIAAIACPLDR
jgi:hypothetical protein